MTCTADKPIIFSAPMVRALLDGRKTQTRRVVKPWPGMQAKWLSMKTLHAAPTCYLATVKGHLGAQFQHPLAGTVQNHGTVDEMSPLGWVRLPYAIGYRLWVREAWQTSPAYDDLKPSDMGGDESIRYAADGKWESWGWGSIGCTDGGRIRPSIHMPRWASRLTLIVTDVRVQRLQEISETDIQAEGVMRGYSGDQWGEDGLYEGFADLWNSLHGPDAWDANPWVAAISFEVMRANIDRISTAIAEGRT